MVRSVTNRYYKSVFPGYKLCPLGSTEGILTGALQDAQNNYN